MSVRTILLAVFVLGVGCKSAPMRTAGVAAPAGSYGPEMPMEADAAGGGGDDGGMYDDAAGDEMYRMDEPAAMGGEIANIPPADKAARVEPEPMKPKPEPADDQPQVGPGERHIVYTAAMMVSVFNLEDAMVKAEAIPETYGGYIQSMDIGVVVLRIPSKSLRTVMDEVAEYGVVEQRSLRSQDVTAEFVDIESRLKALEETHKQLLALLSKARTVKEALEVRQALDRITSELEVLKGRMRQLKNLIAFSTLSLTLQERGPHMPTPSSNDPFPWVNDLGVESTEWR